MQWCCNFNNKVLQFYELRHFSKVFFVCFAEILYICTLNRNKTGAMKEMQFTAVVLMMLMALSLATLLPRRVVEDRVANRSRWLMTAGLTLIAVQFLIQYLSGFRAENVSMAIIVNIAFFIPTAALMSLNIINLERQGHINRVEWLVGLITWLVAMALLLFGASSDPLSGRLLWAEVIASAAYGLMQIYYSWLHLREVSRMELMLADYYDQERGELLNWMKRAIVILALTTAFVPLLIFSNGWLLACFALFLFFGIYYMWFCFVRYVLTSASKRVREAEQSAEQEERETPIGDTGNSARMTSEALLKVDKAVEHWMADGRHLLSGTTKPVAAQEMQLPQYLLSAWVKARGYGSYTRWITVLRVAEAKQTLLAHPDWSNEIIADHCGISRSHFQRVFKQETGLSPADFVANNAQ